ncbi:MAG: tetratricopeptide repeat protein, partial [Chloroflexi bacterium]|nr:tetratricopeptide repeat protein [Chloroflexota bacterium]
ELLLRLTNRPPLIIFLDDLQWADGASLSLLHYLVLESQALRDVPPVLLIGAFRPEEADDNPALNPFLRDLHRTSNMITLDLSPLDADAIAILVQRHNLKVDAGDVWEATRGNPLYVVEILNELVHMTGQRMPIPPSLNSLVQRRLGQLNASGRQVMEAIAVIDAPVMASTAHQISGRSEDEVADAIDAGLRWGFLHTLEDTRPLQFDYQHDLLREAVRAQLTSIRRQRLHERAATTLMAASAPPSQIAYHWHMAGDDAQEGQFSLLAGKEAARLFAHDDAIRYLQRALKLVQDPAVGADILIKLGDVHFTMGEWQAAEGRYRVALVLASAGKHQLQLADAKSHLGMLLRNQGDYGAALKASQEALAIYKELGNLKGQMYSIGSIGSVHWRQANYNQALECYDTHYDMAIEINDLEGAMVAQGSTAGVYMQIGEHELALQNFEQALDLAHQINDQGRIGKITGNMGLVYQLMGDYENAMRCFFGQLTHDYELEDKVGIATAISNVAAMSALEGHYDAAFQCSAYHLQQSLNMHDRRATAIALNNIALVDMRRGHHQRAERLSKLAIQLARSLGIRFQLCAWLYQDALRLLERDDITRANVANREALTMAREIERKEIMFDAQVLDLELRFRLAELPAPDALAELKTLLDDAANDKAQAAILFTMWRIDSTDSVSAEQAAALYRDLYPTSPDITYRERYHELTGEMLPLATQPPDLPDFITERMAVVDELIAQVEVVPDKKDSSP